MDLLREFLTSERRKVLGNDIRLIAIGDILRLPEGLLDRDATAFKAKMTLALAVCDGRPEELVAAARQASTEAAALKSGRSSTDAEMQGPRLRSLCVGDSDLSIRTEREFRLSNFLLYGAAYAELSFFDQWWPDFDKSHLSAASVSYQQCERRLGRASKLGGNASGVPA